MNKSEKLNEEKFPQMRLKQISQKKEHRIIIKVSDDELKLIKEKANIYAGGNYSAWIRYSACQLRPRSEDLIFEEEET